MERRQVLAALEDVIKAAERAGARPGDPTWQPRIDRAWRRALDAGIRCHIHEPGPGERWMLTTDVTGAPDLDPANE